MNNQQEQIPDWIAEEDRLSFTEAYCDWLAEKEKREFGGLEAEPDSEREVLERAMIRADLAKET